MKSNTNIKMIILITFGIFFALSTIFDNNLDFNAIGNDKSLELENENLKTSKIFGKIHIDNNWSDAQLEGYNPAKIRNYQYQC